MLAHYRLGEKIGEGGMGVVFKALDTKLQRTVALKVLPPGFTADPERRLRFQREAQTAAALNHPGIAVIHQVGEECDTDFIVMEYIEGQSLRQALGERALPVKDWIRIGLSLAEAVDYAHRHGVIHRDLKPDNVMVTPDGRVKILDFGLAKLLEPPAGDRPGAVQVHSRMETVSRELTMAGRVFGTLPYMSPEQVRGDAADGRSDLFSLGILLYEMASGRSPFRAKTDIETLHGILNVEPPPLAGLAPELPAEVERIVRKSLEKEPERRYQSATDLATDLRNFRRDLETGRTAVAAPAAGGGRGGPAARARVRRRRRWIGAGAILLAAAAGGTLLARKGARERPAAVPETNSLAIMYFENVPDPADAGRLGQMITSLLITDLSESPDLRVVSRQRLFDILRLLGEDDAQVIDAKVASEVAQKSGVNWILTGAVLQTEPGFVLTASISDARSGDVIASQRVSAPAGETLFGAVDRLSGEIRRDLAPARSEPPRPDRPVTEITTASAEAYREYLAGLDDSYKFLNLEAKGRFQRAVELDSTFAMAHYHLARLSFGAERQAFLEAAMRHADRVTDRDRYFIRGLAAEAADDRGRALAILEEAVTLYPDDKEFLARLAILQRGAGDWEREIETLRRIIELDPLDKLAHNQLAYAYDAQGDLERSLAAVNTYISLVPDEPNPYDSRGDLYAGNGKIAEAMASYGEAIRRDPNFFLSRVKLAVLRVERREYAAADSQIRFLTASEAPEVRAAGRTALSLIPIAQGRLRRAAEVLEQGAAADRRDGFEQGSAEKLGMVVLLQLIRRDFIAARKAADRVAPLQARLFPQSPYRGREYLIPVLAASGRAAEAKDLWEEIERDVASRGAAKDEDYWLLGAEAAMAAGDSTHALAFLGSLDGELPFWAACWAGSDYLKLGRVEEAVRFLELATGTFDESRVHDFAFMVLAHYKLGAAYQASGWTQKAAAEFRTFLAFWGEGDPDLAEVKEARERLRALEAPP